MSLPAPRPFTTRSGVTLNLSSVGLGTAPLGNMFQALSEAEAEATFGAALDGGVTYFDTAPLYGFGMAERRLGMALRKQTDGGCLVSTKAGRLLEVDRSPDYVAPPQWVDVPSRQVAFDYSYDGFMRSFEVSLERMGRDRVDILYCHDIDIHTHGSAEARDARTAEFLAKDGGYRALEELRKSGAVDAIGIGVNEWEISERIARETDVDVFLLAGRFTLLEQDALKTFLPLCLERDMRVVIGGPFNSGVLASGAVPGAYYNYAPAPVSILDRVDRIDQICRAHGVALKRAAVQFPLLHPAVLSVIPGGQSAAQISENIVAFDAPVPAALWHDLQSEDLIHAAMDLSGAAHAH